MDIDVRKDILPWIQGDATDAVLLLEHPHNEQLVCDSQGFHLFEPETQKNRRLRGLTSPLAELFWPEQLLPAVRSTNRRPVTPTTHPSSAQTAARGILRGNIIHSQIQALVSLDAERFHRKYASGAHPWSIDALQALRNHGMRPLASELGIAALDLGIATNLDMVAVRRDGTIVFIEWKTGYEGDAWTSATHWMRGPLRGVLADSARNRAIVQVVLGAMIAWKSRGLQGLRECWVVHISSTGTEFIPVEHDFVNQYGPLLYRALYEHQLTRKRKTPNKNNNNNNHQRRKRVSSTRQKKTKKKTRNRRN